MGNIQKINRRLGFNAQEFMVAIAIAFGVIALIVYGAGQFQTANNVTLLNPQFNSSYNNMETVSSSVSSMYGNMSSGDSLELSSITSVFAFTKAATKVLGLFFDMPKMLWSLTSEALIMIGIDRALANILLGIITTIITIIIVFAIISFLTRSKV